MFPLLFRVLPFACYKFFLEENFPSGFSFHFNKIARKQQWTMRYFPKQKNPALPELPPTKSKSYFQDKKPTEHQVQYSCFSMSSLMFPLCWFSVNLFFETSCAGTGLLYLLLWRQKAHRTPGEVFLFLIRKLMFTLFWFSAVFFEQLYKNAKRTQGPVLLFLHSQAHVPILCWFSANLFLRLPMEECVLQLL